MRVTYVGHTRFPTEKAHGHQIAQVCSAMAGLGHDVTLLTPGVGTPIIESPFAYYGAAENFEWKKLQSFDALHSPLIPMPFAFAIGMWSYRRALRSYLSSHSADILYCRSHVVLPPLLEKESKVILELHRLPGSSRQKFASQCNRCYRVVCLTSAMREQLVSWGVDANRVIVEGDAVDLSRFQNLLSSEEAKRALDLPSDKTIIGYVGRLKTMDMEKGLSELLQALSSLKEKNVMGLIVGGPEKDRCSYEKEAASLGLTSEHVRFTGEIPAADVPGALAACDILAMPFPDLPHYRTNMSPLKMFEYMAAGKSIITSDLPPIRDVLSETSAFFCTPGDANSLVSVISSVLENPEEAQKRSAAAKKLSQEYSWEKRMARILL